MRKKSQVTSHKLQVVRRIRIIILLFLVTCVLLLLTAWWRLGWDGKEPINIVISSQDRLWVVGARPEENKLVQIEIPPNTIIPAGEGTWQARALWELSQLEGNSDQVANAGWELLQIPIDYTIRLSVWRGRSTSYLAAPTALKLISFMRGLHEGQIIEINLGKLSIARRVVDPGGTELISLNQDQISPLIADWFQIGKLRQETISVAVRNASQKPGAAAKLARQLENSGIHVVSVSDGNGRSSLIVKNKSHLKTLTVKKLSVWLNLKPEVGDFSDRADILIVL